jgi:glyoxylase-like metal-dependent hydrolase (beta-lactamase superfamily II)
MTPLESTDFTPGRVIELAVGVRRVVAANGGMMTGPGTNTYVLGEKRVVIVDPGPAIDGQVEAIERAVGTSTVEAIVVTHTHIDHSPAALPLAEKLGVPLIGRPPRDRQYQDPHFQPDRTVDDGDQLETDLGPLRAILTPGHASNHVCWHLVQPNYICTGDHILGSVSPVIVHPDGSLREYLASLEKVKQRQPKALLPGHGPVVCDPIPVIDRLAAHRYLREQRVLAALADGGCHSVAAILPRIYADVPKALHEMARHTLLAHLMKLEEENRVAVCGEDAWRAL